MSNCSVTLLLKVGVDVLFFSPAVVWRRRRKKSALVEVEMCVCIQGILDTQPTPVGTLYRS